MTALEDSIRAWAAAHVGGVDEEGEKVYGLLVPRDSAQVKAFYETVCLPRCQRIVRPF